MGEIFYSPFFGIAITILTFEIGIIINRKFKSALANPLLISVVIIIAFLLLFDIPIEAYNEGGEYIAMMLAPATAALGLSMYRQLKTLKQDFLPIIIGTGVGAAVSLSSVVVMCRLFHLDEAVTTALLPKTATTPISLALAEQYGGLVPVTSAAVMITGLIGATLMPIFIRLFKIENSVAVGVAMGTSSHGLGTAKAIELGEVEGAMSGVAIGITGIWTVVLLLFVG